MAHLIKSEGLSVIGIHPSRDKVTRLLEKQAMIEQGLLSFDPEGAGVKEVTEQLVDFPNVIHDDLVDALVYSLYDKIIEVYVGVW